MSFLTTQAVVLRRMRLGESDNIVTFLTREAGLVKAVAKGAAKSRKRFGGVLLTGNHVDIRLFLKKRTTLHRLDAADLVEPYAALSTDPALLAAGSHLLELTAGFAAPHQADPRQFTLLTSTLRALCSHGHQERLLRIFELRTLAYAGVAPNFSSCVHCGKPLPDNRTVAFSFAAGGVSCASCASDPQARRVPPGTRRLLADVLVVQARMLPRLSFKPADLAVAKTIVPPFCEYTLGRKLRSLRMLKRLLAEKGAARSASKDS